MFESATFESAGSITTHSRRWMLATLAINGSVVAALILIPLMHPELLPGHTSISVLTAPLSSTPPPLAHTPLENIHAVNTPSVNPFAAPRVIPTHIPTDPGPQPAQTLDLSTLDIGHGSVTGAPGVFRDGASVRVVRDEPKGPVRVSSRLLEGSLIFKKTPAYPPIAIASRTEGTVLLQATISKAGTIENLRVMGGPAMLQQAALDAVKSWRYRPYVLNGQPVEVETTVNVVFTLSR